MPRRVKRVVLHSGWRPMKPRWTSLGEWEVGFKRWNIELAIREEVTAADICEERAWRRAKAYMKADILEPKPKGGKK